MYNTGCADTSNKASGHTEQCGMNIIRHGHDLKKAILKTIFDRFDDWSKQFSFACRKGCTVCCTQNVTVTAVEAQMLLDYIVSEDMQHWLKNKLGEVLPGHKATMTTNQFAQSCLEGHDPPIEAGNFDLICPFLENGSCMVYPARPFSCRCFSSTVVCRPGGNATVPPVYLSAATAVSQIIEHLGQFNTWGNMLNVLYILGSETGIIDSSQDKGELTAARAGCITAQPLPGFLLDDVEGEAIIPLLESIFTATVDGKSIENILNSR